MFVFTIFVLWTAVCISSIFFYLRLLSKPGSPEGNSLVDFQFDAPDASGNGMDFAGRLHKLEGLKRDGLVSDSEYEEKRLQILREKW